MEATSPPLEKEHWHDTRTLYLVWLSVGTTLQRKNSVQKNLRQLTIRIRNNALRLHP